MSLAEGILWFLSTFVSCWGATLIVRGLRGEGIRKRWAKGESEKPKARYRPTWRLVGLGLAAFAGGAGCGWGAITIQQSLNVSGNATPSVTPWHLASGGVALFGIMVLTHAIIGDRSKGRKRCPRCWYDLSGLLRTTNEAESERREGSVQSFEQITCPECGRVIEKMGELHRARRSKFGIAFGAMVLAVGVGGYITLSSLDLRNSGASLLPDWVVIQLSARSGKETSDWLHEELVFRLDPSALPSPSRRSAAPFAESYLAAWVKHSRTSRSLRQNLRLAKVATTALERVQHGADYRKILRWLPLIDEAYYEPLVAGLCSSDVTEASAAAEMVFAIYDYPMIIRPDTSYDQIPSRTIDHARWMLNQGVGFSRLPFEIIDTNVLADVITSEDAMTAAAAIRLMPHQHAHLYLDELVSNFDKVFMQSTLAAHLLGRAAAESDLVLDRLLDELEVCNAETVESCVASLMWYSVYSSHASDFELSTDSSRWDDAFEGLVSFPSHGHWRVMHMAVVAIELLEIDPTLTIERLTDQFLKYHDPEYFTVIKRFGFDLHLKALEEVARRGRLSDKFALVYQLHEAHSVHADGTDPTHKLAHHRVMGVFEILSHDENKQVRKQARVSIDSIAQ